MKRFTLLLTGLLLVLSLGACGGGGGSGGGNANNVTNYTYATTSSNGDYAEWTISGDQLSAIWYVMQKDGLAAYAYLFNASCGIADSFGVRNCTVDAASSQCIDQTVTCQGSFTGDFDMMEEPGLALFVRTGSGSSSQLAVGFAKDSGACTLDVSGDYTTIHTGLGSTENFGIYRFDTNLLNVIHGDFGFNTSGATTTPTVAYRTGTASIALTDDGCDSGVRGRINGTDTIYYALTGGGLSVTDLPAGQGGLLSFKVANAATLADFANKSFGGISFSDKADADPVSIDAGALIRGGVAMNATFASGNLKNFIINPLTSASLASSPAYPDFTVAPSGYTSTSNPLATDYPAPADIPGLFKFDGNVLGDTGRVILAAMKFNGKVIGIGLVYDYRTTADINPVTGANFTAAGLYNTGNFILFEK